MKVLIYGFNAYKEWKENISEEIIKRIKTKKNIKKVILKTNFNSEQILDLVKKFNPDLIVGLGQHPRARKVRIERKAVNLKRKSKKEKPTKIIKDGPKHYFVNLKLKKDKDSIISYSAGQYVCNFSMYIILNYIQNKRTRFCYLHFPKDLNLKKGVKYVEKIIISNQPNTF